MKNGSKSNGGSTKIEQRKQNNDLSIGHQSDLKIQSAVCLTTYERNKGCICDRIKQAITYLNPVISSA